MATRNPLVLISGKIQELPASDVLAGSSAFVLVPLGTSSSSFQSIYDNASNGSTLFFVPGSYTWSGAVNLCGGVDKVIMMNGVTITTSATTQFYTGGDRTSLVSNVTLQNGVLTTTSTSTSVQTSIIQSYENAPVNGLFLKNMRFNAPTANCNAVGATMWSSGSQSGNIYTNVICDECTVNVGRMGFEFINHSWDNSNFTYRISDVHLRKCKSIATGLVTATNEGMFCSFSGVIEQFSIIDCHPVNARGTAFEIVGCRKGTVVGNTYSQTTTNACAGIGITDNNYYITEQITVSGNIINTPYDKPFYSYGTKTITTTGNTFYGLTYCDFKTERSTFTGNTINVNSAYAMAFDSSVWDNTSHYGSDGNSKNNTASGNTFDTSRYSGGTYLVIFRGTGVTSGNNLDGPKGNTYINSTGPITSGYFSQAGSASGNDVSVHELVLGNPASDGQVLASTIAGVRSWVTLPSGGTGPDMSLYRLMSIQCIGGITSFQTNCAQPPTTAGTATLRNPASTNLLTRQRRIGYVGTATANNYVLYNMLGVRFMAGQNCINTFCFAIVDTLAVNTGRTFVGFIPSSPPGNVEPSTYINSIGIGSDVGDTNLSFFCNDASGTATKIGLGANFPAYSTGNSDFFTVAITCRLNGTAYDYYIKNHYNGSTASGTATTNLPVAGTNGANIIYRHNGVQAVAASVDFMFWNCVGEY